jgi:hypothetical protein
MTNQNRNGKYATLLQQILIASVAKSVESFVLLVSFLTFALIEVLATLPI